MSRQPIPYKPFETAKNLAKKYEGKTAVQQESMIKSDQPFFKQAMRLGGSVRVPAPVDVAKINAVSKFKRKAR